MPRWGKIMIPMYMLWLHSFYGYMDFDVGYLRKVVTLNHSLTHYWTYRDFWLLLVPTCPSAFPSVFTTLSWNFPVHFTQANFSPVRCITMGNIEFGWMRCNGGGVLGLFEHSSCPPVTMPTACLVSTKANTHSSTWALIQYKDDILPV